VRGGIICWGFALAEKCKVCATADTAPTPTPNAFHVSAIVHTALTTLAMDFKWTTGGDTALVHEKELGAGGSGSVHQVFHPSPMLAAGLIP
jgi:hypothetical protein